MAIGTATALAIGSVASAGIGAISAGSASSAAVKAANNETQLQAAIYEDTSEKLEPTREAGMDALGAYLFEMGLGEQPEGYGGYEQSPMAQYLMEEGAESIDAAFAARGGYNSGAALEALEDNRRQIITADTDTYFNRLLGLADRGFDAASGQGAAGRYYASSAGAAGRSAASVVGQGAIATGQALSGGIEDIAGIYGYFNNSNPMAAYSNPMWGAA